MTLFETGIRPKIDEFLDNKSKERRDYGDYWSASSAGHCMRKNIFERMKLPHTNDGARNQRVFEAGHIFHEWIQRITSKGGMSIAQEVELQDEELMVRGHIDDLIAFYTLKEGADLKTVSNKARQTGKSPFDRKLILYDYKTQNSRAFTWQKDKPISHFHRMQLGTYMLMLRNEYPELTEARILKISKDDLRMAENVIYWTPELESRITTYWRELNGWWDKYKKFNQLPQCTCADYENGFMANEKYNPFFKYGEPCSKRYFEEWISTQGI